MSVEFLGIPFFEGCPAGVAETLTATPVPATEPLRLLVTANSDHLRLLREQPEFRTAYRQAWRVLVDGAPLAIYLSIVRRRRVRRIAGADLFPQVMARLDARHRPFFVVARPAIADALRMALQMQGIQKETVGFAVPPMGFYRDEAASAELLEMLLRHRPTHIFFGVGAPQSEVWLARHATELCGAYGMCFGAGLGFYVGVVPRAPLWMRRFGLEWCHRLMLEPARMAPRYFRDLGALLLLALDGMRGRRLLD